jgi:beta-glucosidase/6-phospho-beta-glucosidase/beta-galactosidase
VDFKTQERTPKESALWYRDAILANAVDDGEGEPEIAPAQRSA